ncbi:MerR family transcriptional regulator [Umezawaea sp. Da 62-37]|uniref:MerR family transcriptional regulator n=1 Tax=Umezawaea sp. Da 62-37 TaxID=3075927 RepID=UPI0028F7302A|nr:MerR family transcriptional regulator [Umezawaea sp. Da 62-37]WNV84534.1 MerR family transcriptional regulator [Umezawaea sp. Da 62-37]
MKVSELASAANVSIPKIKYYLREGMLPPGTLTSPNQAWYGAAHLRRLKVIRALAEVGGLSIAVTRDVLLAVDNEVRDGVLPDVVTTTPDESDFDTGSWSVARARVEGMLARHGLGGAEGTASWRALVTAVAVMVDLGRDDLLELVEPYLVICTRLVDVEAGAVRCADDAEGAVLGTVLGDVVLSALRRLVRARPD